MLDETSAQIVAVLSGPEANASSGASGSVSATDIGTRVDAYAALIHRALAEGAPFPSPTGRAKTKKGPIDLGASCQTGADCAAGACVTDASRQYCSRTCSARDRCPTRFRCAKSNGPAGPASVCVES